MAARLQTTMRDARARLHAANMAVDPAAGSEQVASWLRGIRECLQSFGAGSDLSELPLSHELCHKLDELLLAAEDLIERDSDPALMSEIAALRCVVNDTVRSRAW